MKRKQMQLTGTLLAAVLLAGASHASVILHDTFTTTGGPDMANGLYQSGADLGDAGNNNAVGGTIVGFSSSDAWTDSAYIESYANLMRIRSTKYSWTTSGRAIAASMAGKTEAYAKMPMRQHLDAASASQGYVFAGVSASAALGYSAGATIGYAWDNANSHWDMALRYSSGGSGVYVTIQEDAPYNVTQEIYWSMDQDADTIKVWVDNNDYSSVPDLTVTDWDGTVEGISHVSAGGYESGTSSSTGYTFVYDITLGDTGEDVGMIPEPGTLSLLGMATFGALLIRRIKM